MYCNDIQACFHEINAYCAGEPTGRALLVNTENYTVYQNIKMKLEADNSKQCVYVSKCCAENDLPNMDDAFNMVTGKEDFVLIGFSQAGMLRSAAYLERLMGVLLEVPVSGHTVVLLDHCEQYVKKHFSIHPDIQKRVVLVEGETSSIPRIRLAANAGDCIGTTPLPSIKRLLAYLEMLTDETVSKKPEVTVITKYTPELFQNALFSVTVCDDVYERLCKNYPDVSSGTIRKFGTDQQWSYLAKKLAKYGNLSAVANSTFGSSVNLSSYLGEVLDEGNANKYWLLWLCMKVFNNKTNRYLNTVMLNSVKVTDFEEHVYFDILEIPYDDSVFRQCYTERKRLLEAMPENIMLLDQYCNKIGIKQREAVYYLTDMSEKEELAFMQCLATYNYTKGDLLGITDKTFPSLNSYLQKFVFNDTNTKVPAGEADLQGVLTDYFEQYKVQKLTNRISPAFMEEVEEIATTRPYNKLQARSAIVSKLDKANSQLYFFDALGVEYMGYIQSRCEHYELISEVTIGHCELPSITEKNKEFIHFFPNGVFDIKDLDELKHHSQIIDYEQCKEPVHIFKELQIIDGELRKIQSRLKQGYCDKAIIISDHGASRLAVIYEQENGKLELEEKGKHSGRCCPVQEDPNIPYVSYWNGYAVLANYERFKGGRKANVEVHGGATLEEVIVPIIVLTKRPTNIDICFVDPVVVLKGKEPATITLFSNVPLHEPKLVVNEKTYLGEFCEDAKHVKFVMPEMKRTKDWTADFYDGDKRLASGMEFHVQKNTQEQTLFKKSPF